MASNKSYIVNPVAQYQIKQSPIELAKHLYQIDDQEYHDYPHIRAIENFILGEMKQKLGARCLISLPARHGKSLYTAQFLSLWYLLNNPTERVILLSYNDSIIRNWSKAVKRYIEDPKYQLGLKLRKDTKSAVVWTLEQGGGLLASGTGGMLTGFGASLIIVDDLIKNNEEILSPALRESREQWWKSVVMTRLKKGGHLIVNGTRFGKNDHHDFLLSQPKNRFKHLVLPAMAEENDPLGRAVGEPLCRDIADIEDLEDKKVSVGARTFRILFQQSVIDDDATVIKRKDIKYYHSWELPSEIEQIYISCDFSFQKIGDFTSIIAVAKCQARYYLLEALNKRMSFVEALDALRDFIARYPNATVLIEKAASGEGIANSLEGTANIILIKPTKNKISRLITASPVFEAGNFYFPEIIGHPENNHLEDLIIQLTSMPFVRADDFCDSVSQLLNFCLDKKSYINPFLRDNNNDYDCPSFSGFKMDID